MSAVRRTVSDWGNAPTDGTPFHILNVLRFNPLAKRYEALVNGDDGAHAWAPVDISEHPPTKWLRLVPLPYEIPTSLAFTLTYSVRPKTWRERLAERLFGNLNHVMRYWVAANSRAEQSA